MRLTFYIALLFALTVFSAVRSHAATASWTAVTDPTLQGYNLYRAPGDCSNPGAFAKVASYPATATTGVAPNPTTNGSYCHRLTSFNEAGESPFSNTAGLTYVVNPTPAPQNFTVTK